MSNATTLLSRLVPVAISTDGGSSYKNVVCKKSWDLTLDKTLVKDESDCGIHTSVGIASDVGIGFEFIFNASINSASEMSANQLMSLANNGTNVIVKLAYPSPNGTTYLRQASGYFTQIKESAPLNGFITCTATFTMDGILTQ